MIRFQTLGLMASALYFCLFGLLLSRPGALLSDLGVPDAETGVFVCERAAMLMLGFSIITFLARNTRDRTARRAITAGVGCSMLGLAMTGLFALANGFVNRNILLSVGVEIGLAVHCLLVWWTDRTGDAFRRGEKIQ